MGSYYLDLLIEEEKKNEGRKKRNKEIKSDQKTKQQKVESLKKLTKFLSAQLSADNHNVRDLVYQKNAAISKAAQLRGRRKQRSEEKTMASVKHCRS